MSGQDGTLIDNIINEKNLIWKKFSTFPKKSMADTIIMWIDVNAILYVEFLPKHVSYAQRTSFFKGKGPLKIRC